MNAKINLRRLQRNEQRKKLDAQAEAWRKFTEAKEALQKKEEGKSSK